MTPGARLLVIDTALARAVVALGTADGQLVAQDSWVAGHRHGEELLPHVAALLAATDLTLADLAGFVIGTGPGAFTGLRVGFATAKALAHGLGRPIAGVSTAAALLAAAREDIGPAPRALLLPAGHADRILVLDGEAALLPTGSEPDARLAEVLVAVDLPDRAPADARARGERAVAGLAGALLRLGGARLLAGDADDLARLVPDYVTLPRGVLRERGEVEWSRGPR